MALLSRQTHEHIAIGPGRLADHMQAAEAILLGKEQQVVQGRSYRENAIGHLAFDGLDFFATGAGEFAFDFRVIVYRSFADIKSNGHPVGRIDNGKFASDFHGWSFLGFVSFVFANIGSEILHGGPAFQIREGGR